MEDSAVDRSRPQKLYCQLLQLLKGPIERGDWRVGSRIPTEKQLCGQYRVSRTTARQATEELVSLGYVSRLPGKGTFVRRRVPEESLRMATYLNAEHAEFTRPQAYRVLSDGPVRPPLEIVDCLALAGGEPCRRLERMQLLGGTPLAVERLFTPCRCGAGRPDEGSRSPLTACLEGRCGARIQRLREKIGLLALGEFDASLLGLRPGTPALRLTQIFYRAGDRPMGFAETVCRVDRYERILEYERV